MQDRKILYIEDNYHNRRVVRKILQSKGYWVIEAETGEDGLAMLGKLKTPLVLLDIGLPGIDGLEVVKRIREDEDLKDTYVIAITAAAMQGDQERFLDAGCDNYMSKPIRAMELIDIVSTWYPEG
jgi:two-component system, cell cycle response regulator DivK